MTGCREEQWLERMSSPLLIKTMTESPRLGVGGQQREELTGILPVWALADNTCRESAVNLRDLVKA